MHTRGVAGKEQCLHFFGRRFLTPFDQHDPVAGGDGRVTPGRMHVMNQNVGFRLVPVPQSMQGCIAFDRNLVFVQDDVHGLFQNKKGPQQAARFRYFRRRFPTPV